MSRCRMHRAAFVGCLTIGWILACGGGGKNGDSGQGDPTGSPYEQTDCLQSQLWCFDGDGDGLGDPGDSYEGCAAARFVTLCSDCNDGDAAIGGPGALFADGDGDGYGDPNTSEEHCPTSGWVEDPTDCNDGDPGVSPGAFDLLDGVDNDCNLRIDDGPMPDTASLVADLQTLGAGSVFVGDVLGAGTPQVVLGAEPYGGTISTAFDPSLRGQVLLWSGGAPRSMAGPVHEVAEVADVNRDGVDDVILTTDQSTAVALGPVPESFTFDLEWTDTATYDVLPPAFVGDMEGSGSSVLAHRVYEGVVYLLDADLPGSWDLTAVGPDLVSPLPPPPGGQTAFGAVVDGGGDTDGDGRPELLVTEPYGGDGYAYVIHDRPPPGTAADVAAATVFEGVPGERLGYAGGFAGDLDGDGYDDLFLGGNPPISTTTGVNVSAAGVFSGPLPATASSADSAASLSDSDTAWLPAEAESLGDIDHDGYDDLAVVAHNGWVLVPGPLTGSVDLVEYPFFRLFTGAGPNTLAVVPDQDADGWDDLVFFAETYPTVGNSRYIFLYERIYWP